MKNSKLIFIFLIFALSIYALHPLFNKYTFCGHDMTSHIERCIELKYALSHGILFPRIFTNLCYGFSTPILNYQSPLFYYAVCFAHPFFNNITVSLKFICGLFMLLSGLFMYQLVRYLWDDKAGVIAALLYIYTPYHISQLYVRAALTEFFAVTLFPIMTCQLLKYFDKKTPWRFFLLSVLIALLFLSHNPMALLFPPLLACISIYKAILERRMSLIWDFFKLFILGILLSAFFLAPAILEKKYIALSKLTTGITDFHNHFVYFYQFFSPFWGYEWSQMGPIDGMSFQLGIINVLAVIMAFFLYSKIDKKNKFTVSFILVFFFLSMFLMMRQSEGLWELIPYLQYMWLPWRFLAITAFLSSILAGFVFSKFFDEKGELEGLSQIFLIGIIIILSALPCLNKRDYYTKKDQLPFTAEDIKATNTTTSYQDEYLPLWVTKKPESMPSAKIEPLSLSVKISEISIKPLYYQFTCSNQDNLSIIRINTFYFPGWKAFINKKEAPLLYDGEFNGVMHLTVPSGESKISLQYVGTRCQKISCWISLLTFAGFLIYTFCSIRKKEK